MALFMFLGRYSPDAIKAILESGSNREEQARKAFEAAGGELLGFYGMFGQEHNVVAIADMPGTAEYIGAIAPVLMSGAMSSWKSIPLYTAEEVVKASGIAKEVKAAYTPPTG